MVDITCHSVSTGLGSSDDGMFFIKRTYTSFMFLSSSEVTREILNRDVHKQIHFRGMMVGNPYVDHYTNTITMVQAWYYRGLLPWPLFNKFNQKCRDPRKYFSGKCIDYLVEMYRVRGKGINIYALDFPVCVASEEQSQDGPPSFGKRSYEIGPDSRSRRLQEAVSLPGDSVISAQATHLINSTLNAMTGENDESNDPPFLAAGDHYYPCAEQHLIRYLNQPEVVQAIHANPVMLPWKPCSNKVDYSKKDYLTPQNKVYRTLLRTMNDGSVDLDMLIFSGDDDSVCSLAGTQSWIWDLDVEPDKDHYWEPWTVANQTAGYTTRFKLKNRRSSFVFATVHGAGHEVPSYMPREALDLFRRYLRRDWNL
jgi:Serine carboxypeptidase